MTMYDIFGLFQSEKCISVVTCKIRRAFSLKGSFNKINNCKEKGNDQELTLPNTTLWSRIPYKKVTKTQENTAHKRAKRLVIFQQMNKSKNKVWSTSEIRMRFVQ